LCVARVFIVSNNILLDFLNTSTTKNAHHHHHHHRNEMTKFTEHAIGHRRGERVNAEYIGDVMRNTTSFVPSDLSRGYRENRTTGRLEFARDSDELYDAECDKKICFGTFTTTTLPMMMMREVQLLIRTQKKERLGDVRVTQRSKRAIRDMVKRLDVQSAMSLRWKGEWDSAKKTFTMNCHNSRKKNDDEEEGNPEDKEEDTVQRENGGGIRTAGIAECSYDPETRETRAYFSEEDSQRRLMNAHELVGQCANALEFLKAMSEIEMERKGENVVELSLDTHGVAEDIGAGLIAAKLRASKEKENILLKSETEEETAKRMANEMKKVTSSVMNAVKFATFSEKQKRKAEFDGTTTREEDETKKKKKKMSRFEDSDEDSENDD
tara:strand:+ start:1226 stop:2368 length:1143 start_codon:yes stop_codon:yes gene_type:complete